MKKKHTVMHKLIGPLSDAEKKGFEWETTYFFTCEGAVSHNVLYYQQLDPQCLLPIKFVC